MAKIEAELKKAIVELTIIEKDKLLLKLIAKDSLLTDQLQFQLIENSASTQWRRDEIETTIKNEKISMYYDFGDILNSLRNQYKVIQWHSKVTKDKYGEVHLLLLLLKNTLEKNLIRFKHNYPYNKGICNFVVQKTKIILRLTHKLDAEYWLDFEDSINFILETIQKTDIKWSDNLEVLPYKFEY